MRALVAVVLLAVLASACTPASEDVPAGCVGDPTGDVEDGRADVTTACLHHADGLISVEVALADAAGPAGDEGWDDVDTFASWGLDGDGDGSSEVVVVLGIEADGALRGSVVVVDAGVESCIELDTTATEGRFAVTDIPEGCFPDGVGRSLEAVMRYDTTPGDDGTDGVVVDRVPDVGSARVSGTEEDA